MPTKSSAKMRKRLGMTMSPTSSDPTQYGTVNTAGPMKEVMVEKEMMGGGMKNPAMSRVLMAMGNQLMGDDY